MTQPVPAAGSPEGAIRPTACAGPDRPTNERLRNVFLTRVPGLMPARDTATRAVGAPAHAANRTARRALSSRASNYTLPQPETRDKTAALCRLAHARNLAMRVAASYSWRCPDGKASAMIQLLHSAVRCGDDCEPAGVRLG